MLSSAQVSTLLVGDEVHGLGSVSRRNALFHLHFRYRLGLSATPIRLWDDIGTKFLFIYFGNIVYEFPLSRALREINPMTGKTFLTPYYYYPRFVYLTNSEMKKYAKLTKKIGYLINVLNEDIFTEINDEALSKLLFARADIIKNAYEKGVMFEDIISSLISKGIKDHILVYVSENGRYLDCTLKVLKRYGLRTIPFTMNISSKPMARLGNISEREYILRQFDIGEIDALVSMRVLDEGVDIPSARVAIFLASSTNHRQYIQRLGRVLRQHADKEYAIVYDVIVLPALALLDNKSKHIEKSILKREFKRYELISENAINRSEAVRMMIEVRNRLGVI